MVKDPRQTKTIRKLTDFFITEYQQKGVAGLPVTMEEVEPPVTGDEYEARVLAAYCCKPENYKEQLRSQTHNSHKYLRGKRRKKVKPQPWSESSEEDSPELQDESENEDLQSEPDSGEEEEQELETTSNVDEAH